MTEIRAGDTASFGGTIVKVVHVYTDAVGDRIAWVKFSDGRKGRTPTSLLSGKLDLFNRVIR